MSEKQYIDANQLNHDSFLLAKKIYDSGFVPDAMIVLWRGGSLVGMAIQEFFAYQHLTPYHTIVKTSAYQDIDQRSKVRVENMDHVLENLSQDSQVLLIDDIFDTGSTMAAVKEILAPHVRKISIATIFYKPSRSLVDFAPDFYLHLTDKWIVLPHELLGLTPTEIEQKDPFISKLASH